MCCLIFQWAFVHKAESLPASIQRKEGTLPPIPHPTFVKERKTNSMFKRELYKVFVFCLFVHCLVYFLKLFIPFIIRFWVPYVWIGKLRVQSAASCLKNGTVVLVSQMDSPFLQSPGLPPAVDLLPPALESHLTWRHQSWEFSRTHCWQSLLHFTNQSFSQLCLCQA